MLRKCEICDSEQKELLWEQKYFIPQAEDIIKHNIVNCKQCGFVYADNIISQEDYNKYYFENKKYLYDNGNIPEGLRKIHNKSFNFVSEYLKENQKLNNIKILDIGCSTGDLLNEFKVNGYNELLGIDPSKDCSEIAFAKHKIKVDNSNISDFKTNEKFDLIIMSGVLEHINNIGFLLPSVINLLKDDGLMYFAVPDTDNFNLQPREPFHEFSIEHINFFNIRVIKNLFLKYKLKVVDYESYYTDFYKTNELLIICKKGKKLQSFYCKDKVGISKIKKYIKSSKTQIEKISEIIDKLIIEKDEIIVYGVGSLTSRLLADTNLKNANIRCFVDRDKSNKGKSLLNKRIESPDYLKNQDCKVFISSIVYGDEIKNFLLNKYNYKADIILL